MESTISYGYPYASARIQTGTNCSENKSTPITNEREFKRVVQFMNGLIDVVGDDEDHALAGLLDVVGQFVEAYEDDHHPLAEAPAHEVLRFLVEQHGLKQSDLAAEIGGQSVVSDILNGRRAINARQAKALGQRFGVSAAAFL